MFSGKTELNQSLIMQPEEVKQVDQPKRGTTFVDSRGDYQAPNQKDSKNQTRLSVNLLGLGLFRIKSHCTYDLVAAKTEDFSIFQVEILDPRLKQFYKGEYLLEVWTHQGERIFQTVLQSEISHWYVYDNVLIYRGSADSKLIYVIFLKERKMTSVYHPFDNFQNADMIYHDGFILVGQNKSVRLLEITQEEVTTTLEHFMSIDHGLNIPKNDALVLEQKKFAGVLIPQENLSTQVFFKFIYNHLRNEIICVCVEDSKNLVYKMVQINKGQKSGMLMLGPYVTEASKSTNAKPDSLITQPVQVLFQVHNKIPYLFVVRDNQQYEVVENFAPEPYMTDTTIKIQKFLPAFGEKIVVKYGDGSYKIAENLKKFKDSHYIKEDVYFQQQTLPAEGSHHFQIHRGIQFFQDALTVNQSIFLVRDNAIILVDSFREQVLEVFQPPLGYEGPKILKLHKLRKLEEKDGFRSAEYKVVAVHRNGTFQVFVPTETNLMSQWQRMERSPVIQMKDSQVVSSFQSQVSINFLYIATLNNQTKTQTLYQMQFNATNIELKDLNLKSEDTILSVASGSRFRELIAIIDAKYIQIYRIDLGKMTKLLSTNHLRYEIREFINQHSIIHYKNADLVYIFANKYMHKINITTNDHESSKLDGTIQPGGNLFSDANFYYFLIAETEENQKHVAQTKLACTETEMIDASLIDPIKIEGLRQVSTQKKNTDNELMHASFDFGDRQITCLDYDEYNTCVNLLLTDFTIVQVPLLHRNTQQFLGMAERNFYLCSRKAKDKFFALDKLGYVNEWCVETGRLLSRKFVQTKDFNDYQVDYELYDRNWFPYTVIYKQDEFQTDHRRIKVIQITKDGLYKELINFIHPFQRNEKQHFYFNNDFNIMIELSIATTGNKVDGFKGTYKKYTTKTSVFEKKWEDKITLNEEGLNYPEWHHQTLYPYPLNLDDLSVVVLRDKIHEDQPKEDVKPLGNNVLNEQPDAKKEQPVSKSNLKQLNIDQQWERFKVQKGGNTVKVLNFKDWNERIIDAKTGEVLYFMGLQYSQQNSKESFYDKSTGQYLPLEIEDRLQTFYEYIRQQIFLKQRLEKAKSEIEINLKLVRVDYSTRMYKHKYLSEKPYLKLDHQFLRQFFAVHAETEDKELKTYRVVRRMAEEPLKRMLQNVFPCDESVFNTRKDKKPEEKQNYSGEANTFLHYFAIHQLGFESIDHISSIFKKEGFIVPFLMNSLKQTPLDISVEKTDNKMTNAIIKLIKRTPMDNHSRLISHLMPKMIGQMDLPKLNKYFDRRLYQISSCKTTKSLHLDLAGEDYDMKAVPTGLRFDDNITHCLTNKLAPERSVKLEIFDLPLNDVPYLKPEKLLDTGNGVKLNNKEIALIKAFATTKNQDFFTQNSVRAFIDFMWPIAQRRIVEAVFLPYIVFIIFFLLYLMVLKRLSVLAAADDKQFYEFALNMFSIYDAMFKFVLFLGSFYFITHDLQHMRAGMVSNRITLWGYVNILPLGLLMFVLIWDTFLTTKTGEAKIGSLQRSLYSVITFLVWTRVLHLLKCFSQTAHLIRMASEIIYRIRWLIAFIVISLASFGFTYFYVSASIEVPFDGITQMFNVLIGQYDMAQFSNVYESVLILVSSCFNALTISTLLISLSVISFSKGDHGVWSNQAYKDKVSLIGLYSYLLTEEAVRAPSDQYLLLATVTDRRSLSEFGSTQLAGFLNDPRAQQIKNTKSIDRRLIALQSKLDRSLKELQSKIGRNDEKGSAPAR